MRDCKKKKKKKKKKIKTFRASESDCVFSINVWIKKNLAHFPILFYFQCVYMSTFVFFHFSNVVLIVNNESEGQILYRILLYWNTFLFKAKRNTNLHQADLETWNRCCFGNPEHKKGLNTTIFQNILLGHSHIGLHFHTFHVVEGMLNRHFNLHFTFLCNLHFFHYIF